jgi:hypothetical protein
MKTKSHIYNLIPKNMGAGSLFTYKVIAKILSRGFGLGPVFWSIGWDTDTTRV